MSVPAGRVGPWLATHRLELKLSLRITAAGLLAYAAAEAFELAQGYWAVLTAVIVMQASVGGALQAMWYRLIGTIGGAAWGVAVALAVPQTGVVTTGIALTVALVPLAALVAFWPVYRVAPVTAIIVVLIGARGHGDSVFFSGVSRVGEIGLGTVAALAVALLVSPARAQGLLLEAARDGLAAMAEQIVLLLGGVAGPVDAAATLRLHDRIRATLERAQTAASEAARERASHISDAPDLGPLVRTLRRSSHDLATIGRVLATALPEGPAGRLAAPAAAIGAAIAETMTAIGAALVARSLPPPADRLAQAVAEFDAAMAALRQEGLTRALSDEAVGRVFGLAFALEQLRRNLDDLHSRATELAVG